MDSVMAKEHLEKIIANFLKNNDTEISKEQFEEIYSNFLKNTATELSSVQPMDDNIFKNLHDAAKDKQELIDNGYSPVSEHGILWVKE